jgi:hypothetical protein
MSDGKVGGPGHPYASSGRGFPRKGVPCCQTHFRWTRLQGEKNKTIKPLDEKTGEHFHNLGGRKAFLSKTGNPEASKENPDRPDYIKTKHFCMVQDTINKVKRDLTGENI